MWEAGVPTDEIATALGMKPQAVRAWVTTARTRNGTELALRRRRDRDLWPEIERLWNQGLSGPEIARRLNTTKHNVWVMVARMREVGIELTEHENHRGGAVPIATADRVVDLWRRGLTLQQMADELGYSSVASVFGRVAQLRREGCDLPYRKPRRAG